MPTDVTTPVVATSHHLAAVGQATASRFDIAVATLAAKPTIALAVVILLVIATEVTVRMVKRRERDHYTAARTTTTHARELETLSLNYFKKNQLYDILRGAVYVCIALAGVLLYDIQAFSYVLLGLGALIVVLKEMVASVVGYGFVLTSYTVGDDVRINDRLGEIVRIGLLSTSLVGKEDNGEYNGKLFQVPNYHFLQNIVEQQELRSSTLRHITLKAVYTRENYREAFGVWMRNLKHFLDDTLPTRVGEDVGNYRGYTGAKYKTNVVYNDKGDVVVSITFVSSTASAQSKKEAIVAYIEDTKRASAEKKK